MGKNRGNRSSEGGRIKSRNGKTRALSCKRLHLLSVMASASRPAAAVVQRPIPGALPSAAGVARNATTLVWRPANGTAARGAQARSGGFF